jgi:hypothetical protein
MMQFTAASGPSLVRANEDFAVVGFGWAILHDGARAGRPHAGVWPFLNS